MKIFRIFGRYAKKLVWAILLVFSLTIFLNYIRSLIPLFIGKIFGILGEQQDSTLPAFINNLFVGKEINVQLLIVFVGIIITALVRDSVNVASDVMIGFTSESLGYNMQTDFYNRCYNLLHF